MDDVTLHTSLEKILLDLEKTVVHTREETLINTSVIRKLYSSPGFRDPLLHRSDDKILKYLLGCLRSKDQFTVFTASKASIAVLRQCSLENFQDGLKKILSIFLEDKGRDHVLIFTLLIFTELMKCLRKESSKTKFDENEKKKACFCLMLLSSVWNEVASLLTSLVDIPALRFHLVLEQYLSLCLECFRVNDTLDNPLFAQNCFSSFQLVMSMVTRSDYLLCAVRFVDVLRKFLYFNIENEQLLDVSSFCNNIKVSSSFHHFLQVSMEAWFQIGSQLIYNSFVLEYHIDTPSETSESSISGFNLEQTFLRKYLLLSLLLATKSASIDSEQVPLLYNPIYDYLNSLRTLSSQQYKLPNDQLMTDFLQKCVLQLVMEEDDCLIATFSMVMKLFELETKSPLPLIDSVFNVHALFVYFLSSIGYDSSTLLDFVISKETEFDVFLSRYLKSLLSDPGGTNFTLSCQRRDRTIASVEVKEEGNTLAFGMCEGINVCEKEDTSCQDMTQENRKEGKNNDSDSEDETTMEKSLNCISVLYTMLENAEEKGLIEAEKTVIVNEILMLIEEMG